MPVRSTYVSKPNIFDKKRFSRQVSGIYFVALDLDLVN